jgi:hypothetical protein
VEKVSASKAETEEETMACREATEARLEEEKQVSVYTKPAAVQQEDVPIVIPVGEPEEGTTSITRKETMACQAMEAHLEEKGPTSVDRKPEVAQKEEVPFDDAEVMPVGEPRKKRRRDRKLEAQHPRQKPKEFTRENCGPQNRLAVARSGSSHRGNVTWQTKEMDRKIPRRPTVA